MDTLTLSKTLEIIDLVFKEASVRKAAPLTVAVLDKGGALISLQRQDGASLLRPDIAIGKAWGALALGCSSRKIADDAQLRPSFVSSVSALAQGKIIPAAGGVLIYNHNNDIMGAIGITGDSSNVDEALAIYALTQADLMVEQ